MSGELFKILRSERGACELHGLLDINHVEELKGLLEDALMSGENLEVSLGISTVRQKQQDTFSFTVRLVIEKPKE